MSMPNFPGLVLPHGQKVWVYPAAYLDLPFRFCFDLPDIPFIASLLKTPDGIDLACFLLPQTRTSSTSSNEDISENEIVDERVELTEAAAEARATVIVFHATVMDNWDCFGVAQELHKMKCNVFLPSYRGYGFSGGKPNEAGLKIDAQTALDYILSQPYLANVPIILCGHSVGGAVAIDLASRNPSRIASVIVSNTFTSIPDIVRTWPIIGFLSFLCIEKWRSIDGLHLIPTTTPILMISGRRDHIVPPQIMDKLWQAAQKRGIPRNSWFRWSVLSARDDTANASEVLPEHDKFVKLKNGTFHSTFTSQEYWDAVKRFIDRIGAQMQNRPRPAHAEPTNRMPDRRWRYEHPNGVVEDTAEA